MLVDSGEGSEFEGARDFLKARRIAVLVEKADQIIEHFFLPLRQGHRFPPQAYNWRKYRRIKSEKQEKLFLVRYKAKTVRNWAAPASRLVAMSGIGEKSGTQDRENGDPTVDPTVDVQYCTVLN
jgi:hypothetical protein